MEKRQVGLNIKKLCSFMLIFKESPMGLMNYCNTVLSSCPLCIAQHHSCASLEIGSNQIAFES